MKAVTKETMRRVAAEFPTVAWADADLDELVTPRFGVITGFQDLLNQLESMTWVDLGPLGLPGALRAPIRERR